MGELWSATERGGGAGDVGKVRHEAQWEDELSALLRCRQLAV